MTQLKICIKCNQEQKLSEFSKHKNRQDGLQDVCKSCAKEYAKQHYIDNKLRRNEYSKKYAQENREYIFIWRRQYNQDNAAHRSEYNKHYLQTPKGKAGNKAKYHNRKAHKLNNGGKHTAKEILNLFELQSGKCPYCNTKLYKSGNNKYHLDHIVPLSKGGSNGIENLQLLCPKCNLSKSNKSPEEFAAQFNKLF